MAKKKKPAKRKKNAFNLRGLITILAELSGVAGFLLALYVFLKGG
jgi:hypothetical protein